MKSKLRKYLNAFFIFYGLFRTGWTATCPTQRPIAASIKETDPPGHVIFSEPSTPHTIWTVTVAEPLSFAKQLDAFFTTDSNATTTTFSVNKSFDLEMIYEKWNTVIDIIVFHMECSENATTNNWVDFFLYVHGVDEFTPEFINAPFTINVTEDTKVNTTVFKLIDYTQDRDVKPGKSDIARFGMQKSEIPEDWGRLKAQTTLTINILDSDDQPPEFYEPECKRNCFTYYKANITREFTGRIDAIIPSQIRARDRDTAVNNPIIYTISRTHPPGYESFFSQASTGEVSVVKPIGNAANTLSEIALFLEATEKSPLGRSTTTTLRIALGPARGITGQSGHGHGSGFLFDSIAKLTINTK